jgi:glycosyltransferase involved in cell wall biosynthesis
MKISALTYIRNGITYDYPFVESIKSALPIVDEYIVVTGDSNDGTREAITAIGSNKIKIIDTIWDENLRIGGKIFAQQTNIGLDNASKDANWLLHLQADEILHEKDYKSIIKALEENINNKKIDGFLLHFINFYGDYNHYCPTRRFHQREIRIVRNNPQIRSYRDSMGFRKFMDPQSKTEKGIKLLAKQIDATVYHYSWSRNPQKQKEKYIEMNKKYDSSNDWIKGIEEKYADGYNYTEYDYLKKFTGIHPAVMQARVASQDWKFNYDPKKNNMNFKEKVMKFLEDVTGKQFFIYKNYKRIK